MSDTLSSALETIVYKIDDLLSRIEDLELIEFPDRVEGYGNGVADRVAKWSDANTITAAALIAPASNVLTLEAGGAYTLTVNQTLTLAGASGKSLTLTTNLTNQGNNGTLSWGGAYTLTINQNLTLAGASGKTLTLTTDLTNNGGAGTLTWGGAYTLTVNQNLTLTGATGKTLTLTTDLTNNGGAGTLTWGGAYTLTINQNLTLAGATGKSLTLTTNLTNQGGAGTLSWGGTYTLTINATGTAALGAGTLTNSTTNDVTGSSHTHAITASADPGAAASLLKTTSAGLLTLLDLQVGDMMAASTVVTPLLYYDSSSAIGTTIRGDAASDTTTKSTSANGGINLEAQKNGGNMGSDANLVVICNNSTTRFIFDAEGSAHADVEWTTFDEYDDIGLLASLENQISRDPIKEEFQRWIIYNREALERAKLVTFNPGGHNFINTTRLSMLLVGAVKQLAEKIDKLEKGSDYGIS